MRRISWLLCALVLAWAALPEAGHAQAAPEPNCTDNLVAATPSPAITAAEICATIRTLAADSLEGREAGTPGGEAAARWIAGRFDRLDLPGGATGRLQSFTFPERLKRDPHAAPETTAGPADSGRAVTWNVVAVIEGTDPTLREEAVLIGAHHDHLGRGGFGSLDPASGAIHNGADDNASGIAGLLELAGRYAASPAARSIVFVAFGGEELGNLGSQHWVQSPGWPLERTVAMVNLDMIGRQRDRLTVYGTGTSPAWEPILDSIGAGRVEVQRVPDGYGPSDHSSFYGAGVPVLALFTGAHPEYHRPADDPDTIHAEGTVRVIEFAAAVIDAVAGSGREIAYADAPRTERRMATFRVALGLVPDYGFDGTGLSVSSVRAGGPADTAGLRAGDVVVRLAGREVADVYGYTAVLAELEPDAAVEMVFLRDGAEITAPVTPEGR